MSKHDELPTEHNDALISFLHKAIKLSIRILAILMVVVIFFGVFDVVYVLYNQLLEPPFMLLSLPDIFKTFAAFLAVLIAIEIFQNIVLYLRTDIFPLKLVIATALMAMARKIIIIDFDDVAPMHIFAVGSVVLGLGITYYLVDKNTNVTLD